MQDTMHQFSPELLQHARIWTWEALSCFDPSKNVKESYFVFEVLKNKYRTHLRQEYSKHDSFEKDMLSLDMVMVSDEVDELYTIVDSGKKTPSKYLMDKEVKEIILEIIKTYVNSWSARSKSEYTERVLVDYFVNDCAPKDINTYCPRRIRCGKSTGARYDNILKNFGTWLTRHKNYKTNRHFISDEHYVVIRDGSHRKNVERMSARNFRMRLKKEIK